MSGGCHSMHVLHSSEIHKADKQVRIQALGLPTSAMRYMYLKDKIYFI